MNPAYTKEELEILCKESLSYNQVLIKSGRTIGTTNRERLKKYIALYNIDISHFTHSTGIRQNNLLLEDNSSETRICIKCGQTKNKKLDFYSSNNKTRKVCKECAKIQMREAHQKKIAEINNIKATTGCLKCGETRYYLLDFHHKDPNEKDFAISDKIGYTKEKLLEEIDKCDILCSNCHREWHYFLQINPELDYSKWINNQID